MNKIRMLPSSATAGMIILLALAPSMTAQAQSDVDATDSLAYIAPEQLVNSASDVTAVDDGWVVAASGEDGATAQFPADPADGIVITSPYGGFTIGLPSADRAVLVGQEDGIVEYDNGDGSSSVLVHNEDSSTSVNTVIADAEAPTRYDYTYDEGLTVKVFPDGGAAVYDQDDSVVAVISLPWATDSEGIEVPTYYVSNGNVLTQVVRHDKRFAYPIAADPTSLGGNSMFPDITVDFSGSQGTIVRVYPANLKYTTYSNDSIYANYTAIVPTTYEGNKWRDQLLCHAFNVGPLKSPWNLDSWRPDVGYVATVAALCNP